MARIENYNRDEIAWVVREAYREQKTYKNEVDLSRSHLNYSMNGIHNSREFLDRLDLRCKEIMNGQAIQTQTNVDCSWVVTLPQELRGNPEKEQRFFKTVFTFACKRYGKANVIDGIVHYDETSPHITIHFVPRTISRKTHRETISSASLITKNELSTFHNDLEAELLNVFGIAGLVRNDRTKGDYTLEELKERTQREEAMQRREAEADAKLEEAETIKKAALDEADATRAEAHQNAKQIKRDAEELAKKNAQEALRASKQKRAAETEAAAILQNAQAQARDIVQQAKEKAQQFFEDAKTKVEATIKGAIAKVEQLVKDAPIDLVEFAKKYTRRHPVKVKNGMGLLENKRDEQGRVVTEEHNCYDDWMRSVKAHDKNARDAEAMLARTCSNEYSPDDYGLSR